MCVFLKSVASQCPTEVVKRLFKQLFTQATDNLNGVAPTHSGSPLAMTQFLRYCIQISMSANLDNFKCLFR